MEKEKYLLSYNTLSGKNVKQVFILTPEEAKKFEARFLKAGKDQNVKFEKIKN